jgi:hypothetical protein
MHGGAAPTCIASRSCLRAKLQFLLLHHPQHQLSTCGSAAHDTTPSPSPFPSRPGRSQPGCYFSWRPAKAPLCSCCLLMDGQRPPHEHSPPARSSRNCSPSALTASVLASCCAAPRPAAAAAAAPSPRLPPPCWQLQQPPPWRPAAGPPLAWPWRRPCRRAWPRPRPASCRPRAGHAAPAAPGCRQRRRQQRRRQQRRRQQRLQQRRRQRRRQRRHQQPPGPPVEQGQRWPAGRWKMQGRRAVQQAVCRRAGAVSA